MIFSLSKRFSQNLLPNLQFLLSLYLSDRNIRIKSDFSTASAIAANVSPPKMGTKIVN